MTHLSSIRTQRSLNCLWRWCLCCFLCHFFCLPNSSSWLMLSGNKRWGDRLSSSSICWGFREGDVSGTCSESCRAGRAVAEDPCKAGLVLVILEFPIGCPGGVCSTSNPACLSTSITVLLPRKWPKIQVENSTVNQTALLTHLIFSFWTTGLGHKVTRS